MSKSVQIIEYWFQNISHNNPILSLNDCGYVVWQELRVFMSQK